MESLFNYRSKWLQLVLMNLCILSVSPIHCYDVDPLEQPTVLYTDNKGNVLSYPLNGLQGKKVPVINLFIKQPGCYITCHSHNPLRAAYASSPQTYVTGLIRVAGQYNNTVCVPEGLEMTEINGDQQLRELCSKSFMCVGNSCWATGDTGEWFGLK